MRLFRCAVLFAATLLLTSAPVFAGQTEYDSGEVIYHQDFSEISDISLSGIKKGTSSTKQSALVCNNDVFSINTFDDGRVYAILPEVNWTDSFTVEFDFAFKEIASTNGYIALMLTSAGEEPGNITSVVFRAKGSVDDFDDVSEEIAKSIQDGEKITVKIPVEKGVLHKITLSADGVSQELERDSIILIGSGNRGFTVRNASVEIAEVYIVNGTGYTEKTGYWAENSYIEDDVPMEAESENGTETAPATGDAAVVTTAVIAAGSAAAAKRVKNSEK